jgi:hypothetical protein
MSCSAVLFAVLLGACQDIAPPALSATQREPLTCETDEDCEQGKCVPELALCVSPRAEYEQLLIEVIPPSTDLGFGGFRLFTTLREFASLPSSAADLELTQPPPISGQVELAFPPTLACNPVSVKLTLTPRETYLGVTAERYTTISNRTFGATTASPINVFQFRGVPFGTYDVYWEDAGLVLGNPSGCEVVPQIFRGLRVDGALDVPLPQLPPTVVRIEIPWRDDLAGWLVDVVHPVTGERISTQSALEPGAVTVTETGESIAVAELRIAEILGDYVAPKQELLRLRPAPGVNRPTTFLVLFPLVTVPNGPAQVPGPVETFAEQRLFEAWVWQAGEPGVPIAGSVEFIARRLAQQPDGVSQVRFRRSVSIGDDGKVQLELPPGIYTARVYPNGSDTSTFETSVTVWGATEQGTAGDVQAGRVLEVPPGASVTGRVELPGGLSAEDTTIQVVARAGRRRALAERAYIPRSATSLATGEGRFELGPVDCRGCDGSLAAAFTLRAVAPPGTELPWLTQPLISIAGSTDVGVLRIQPPTVHFGKLVFRKANGSVGGFPGALIRAHVVLDADGHPLGADAASCIEQQVADSTAPGCAQRTLQVAETRSGQDGSFRLLLPPLLDGPAR